MAYASFADVQNRWMEPLNNQQTVIETRLDDAELLITNRIPDLDDKVASGKIDEAMVVLVESEMLIRLIRNPEGYMQESDGSYSYMLNQKLATGHLAVEPREWRWLGLSGGAFVIRPYMSIPTDTEASFFQ